MRKHIIKIPIYNGWLHVVDCDDMQQGFEKIKFPIEEDILPVACVVSNHSIKPANWYLLINLKDCDLGVLVHELFHAAHRILDFFCVEFNKKNHEPFAYLIEYLFNECIKIKKKTL